MQIKARNSPFTSYGYGSAGFLRLRLRLRLYQYVWRSQRWLGAMSCSWQRRRQPPRRCVLCRAHSAEKGIVGSGTNSTQRYSRIALGFGPPKITTAETCLLRNRYATQNIRMHYLPYLRRCASLRSISYSISPIRAARSAARLSPLRCLLSSTSDGGVSGSTLGCRAGGEGGGSRRQ